MICVVTGEETQSKTNNIPLSVAGRKQLPAILTAYNFRLEQKFVKSFKEKSADASSEVLKSVIKLAPKVNKKFILEQLSVMSVEELLAQFEEKEENED